MNVPSVIMDCASGCSNNVMLYREGWENYLAAVTNKRYPKPSLKRIFLQLLLHEEQRILAGNPGS
jgi:hypothetical protein